MNDSDVTPELFACSMHEWLVNFPCHLDVQVFVPVWVEVNDIIDAITDSVMDYEAQP